jgi:hypothetical protein
MDEKKREETSKSDGGERGRRQERPREERTVKKVVHVYLVW